MTFSTTATSASQSQSLVGSATDLAAMQALIQFECAEQMEGRLASLSELLKDRLAALEAQATLPSRLGARRHGDDPQGLAALGPDLAASREMLAELNASGVHADASVSYLWLIRSESEDANGNKVVSWSASWEGSSLTDAVADGGVIGPDDGPLDTHGTIDAADWAAAAAAAGNDYPLLGDSAVPPASCSKATTGSTTYYCFEANPNLIVSNQQITDWQGALDVSTLKASAEIDLLKEKLQATCDSYEEWREDANKTPVQACERNDEAADAQRQLLRDDAWLRQRRQLENDRRDASSAAHSSAND